jgi:arginine-tRNA-protein transferase
MESPMISIPLFVTEQHPCSYLDKRNSQSAFITPHCPTCSQCIATRLLVNKFIPNRNQKRCIKKNQQTTVIVKPAKFEQAHYDMYMRYQNHKHEDGGMANSSEDDYINFLASHWCNTLFVEFSINKELAAVAIVDLLDNALSAVYTFFEPRFSQYSLGTYAVLWQQNHAKELELEYVYMGFWIEKCRKMSYKTQFQPMQGFIANEWKDIPG